MRDEINSAGYKTWPTMAYFPLPAKALITIVILTLLLAMAGAMAQVAVHDIIPTFFTGQDEEDSSGPKVQAMTTSDAVDAHNTSADRGDLFSDPGIKKKSIEKQPFYMTEQFIWTLKWTHIHLFGMNMIFIFMGTVTLFLDLNRSLRTWLIILPFVGVLIDIAAMWLKGYISQAYFWLHIPGGGLFGLVFLFVSGRALFEMYWVRKNYAS